MTACASVFLLGLCSETANTVKAAVTSDMNQIYICFNVAFVLLKHFEMNYSRTRSLTLTAVASFHTAFLGCRISIRGPATDKDAVHKCL